MQLKTLILEDFLSYKAETIDFPSGLVAVVGHNYDAQGSGSNGGGKSAIFDAVSWALYGKTIREIGTDDVIRIGAKSCEVALQFELDGQNYFIQRKRGRSSELVFMCGETDLSQSTLALTQEKIDKTLGMDHKMFRVIATFSGDALRFAHATDKEQKEILEKLLGLEEYGLALEKARKELNVLEPGIKFKERQVEQEKGLLQQRKDEIARLHAEKDKAAKDTEASVRDLMQKGTACHDGMARNNAEILAFKHRRTEVEAQLHVASSSDDSPYRELAEIKSQYGAALQSVQAKEHNIKAAEAELDRVTSRVGTPCGECRRPIGEEQVASVMESLAEKILALHQEMEPLQARVRETETRFNTATVKADAFRKADQERAARQQGFVAEIRKCNLQIDSYETQNRELAALLEQHKRTKVQLESVVATFDARIKDATARLIEAEGLILEKTKELAKDRETAEYLRFWEKGFGYTGIRSMLLDGIAEKLTEQTNRYLKILSGGSQWTEFSTQSATKDGEAREKFVVRVSNAHGASGYGGNSAGEKKRVDIAIALALHYLARNRAARALGFAILDEIFECLDEIGCESVVNLLRTEKENLGTIFVVTHNPAMGTRFGATIEVAKKDGVTQLVRHEKAVPECAESKQPSTSPKKAKSVKRGPKTPSSRTKGKATPPTPSPATSSSP